MLPKSSPTMPVIMPARKPSRSLPHRTRNIRLKLEILPEYCTRFIAINPRWKADLRLPLSMEARLQAGTCQDRGEHCAESCRSFLRSKVSRKPGSRATRNTFWLRFLWADLDEYW